MNFTYQLLLCILAFNRLGATLAAPDPSSNTPTGFSNTTTLVPCWQKGTCSFHAAIGQKCYKRFLWSKNQHYTTITYTKGILDGAGNEIPNLKMGVQHIDEPVKGHTRDVMDVKELGDGYFMSMQGFADKVTLLWRWVEWKNDQGRHGKMTWEYGCKWDDEIDESKDTCGAHCRTGAWSHPEMPCDGGIKERSRDIDCWFKC